MLEYAVRGNARGRERRLRGSDQVALDLVWRETRIGLQHQRNDAGGDGGGLRGTRHHEQRLERVHLEADTDAGKIALVRHRTHHVPARRDHLWLHKALIGGTGGGE